MNCGAGKALVLRKGKFTAERESRKAIALRAERVYKVESVQFVVQPLGEGRIHLSESLELTVYKIFWIVKSRE